MSTGHNVTYVRCECGSILIVREENLDVYNNYHVVNVEPHVCMDTDERLAEQLAIINKRSETAVLKLKHFKEFMAEWKGADND